MWIEWIELWIEVFAGAIVIYLVFGVESEDPEDGELGSNGLSRASWRPDEHVLVRVEERVEELRLYRIEVRERVQRLQQWRLEDRLVKRTQVEEWRVRVLCGLSLREYQVSERYRGCALGAEPAVALQVQQVLSGQRLEYGNCKCNFLRRLRFHLRR